MSEEPLHCSTCIQKQVQASEESAEDIIMLLHFRKVKLRKAAYSHTLSEATNFVQSTLEMPAAMQEAYLHTQVCTLDV